ncbi:hypothetical protein DEU56DRAFT_778957 [Suillus clintonianus]|uniref:uncharacterized protein n=1 Tax=Suillus clintonianus TaxID=1904413 RepID=UPI001B8699C8|nr:uncharacterized protein DEU56DRAFT_778957 [Suillus clintonianus]KAG2150897.1 hypothetical protein DEU56DRAFT_778957 [Suillus clintonianus]
MKLSYPCLSEANHNDSALALRIARHSSCAACDSCPGLRPPASVEVVLDDDAHQKSLLGDLTQYGSDEEDGPAYLETCICGHDVADHGSQVAALGREEFSRKARLATRLDDLFQEADRLLDFNYTDEEIDSLRQQMKMSVSMVSIASPSIQHSSPADRPMSPASSVLSDEPPPSKRRRLSSSSLSDAEEEDDDDDDDDKPLAAQVADSNVATVTSSRKAVTQRSGKKTSSMKSKAQTAPTGDKRPEKNGVPNGRSSDLKVKVEDKMDEGQLTRLATGVTVDTGPASSAAPSHKPEKAAFIELRKGIIEITAVENDRQPRSLIILTGLKTLFQTQLPMMPREYIARLVYDHNSKALAIIKRGYKVAGGICYRPFPHRGFAEIVFFATASVDQVKGYGGMLMDNFKQHIKRTYPNVMHFLTYADNFAVVFFKKQGFSKEITLDRSVWAGYIKDYEGGTIMQCTMLRKVNYLDKVNIISQQREAILTKIREMSKSHIVYQGLSQFQEGAPEGITVDPKDVPGLRESGWTPGMEHSTRSGKSAEHTQIQRLLSDLKAHPLAWAFLNPVNADEVPDYYGVIKRPMDFSTMEHKLDTNQYSSLKFFLDDVQLVVDNCKLYNPETSIYHRNAVKLEKFMKEQCAEYAKRGS